MKRSVTPGHIFFFVSTIILRLKIFQATRGLWWFTQIDILDVEDLDFVILGSHKTRRNRIEWIDAGLTEIRHSISDWYFRRNMIVAYGLDAVTFPYYFRRFFNLLGLNARRLRVLNLDRLLSRRFFRIQTFLQLRFGALVIFQQLVSDLVSAGFFHRQTKVCVLLQINLHPASV